MRVTTYIREDLDFNQISMENCKLLQLNFNVIPEKTCTETGFESLGIGCVKPKATKVL